MPSLPTRWGHRMWKIVMTHHCLEVRMGGAAPDFPFAFFSLPYIILMLFIHTANIFASKPHTPSPRPCLLSPCPFSPSFCIFVAFVVLAGVLPPPLSKLLFLMLVKHLGDGGHLPTASSIFCRLFILVTVIRWWFCLCWRCRWRLGWSFGWG